MALFSIFADLDNYAFIGFDRDEIRAKFGSNPKTHIDLSSKPRAYKAEWQSITVNLSGNSEGMTGSNIADIMPFKGKLFLSQKAFEVLAPLIEKDGEFLPVRYENGDGYIFNPLSLAEDVDGLNQAVSHKNELDEIDCMAFHEDRVAGFMVFKTDYDNYLSIICQEAVKEAIEKSGLGGVYFTQDLGNRFTRNISDVIKTN